MAYSRDNYYYEKIVCSMAACCFSSALLQFWVINHTIIFCSDVFPKMWSDFIGCTKSFAATCISSSELSQFNRAVGNSINSVHKMCTNEDYQKGEVIFNTICIADINALSYNHLFGCRLFKERHLHQESGHRGGRMQNLLRQPLDGD
jgi:hypothetical protein